MIYNVNNPDYVEPKVEKIDFPGYKGDQNIQWFELSPPSPQILGLSDGKILYTFGAEMSASSIELPYYTTLLTKFLWEINPSKTN